jgi:hypothetical protein
MRTFENIDLAEFRKEYEIPASSVRAICDELGYKIDKIDGKHYIIGGTGNNYGKQDEYILKHAVLEFRRTMNVVNTKAGKFFEFSEETDINGKKVLTEYGVSKIDQKQVTPKTPSLKRAPNASSVGITGQSSELIPIETHTTAISTPAPEALTALVTALTNAQRATAPREPLLPQKQLKEAEIQGFLITTQQLAELLSMSPQTISSKKSGFIKMGFTYEKVKEGSSTLWKVSQIS